MPEIYENDWIRYRNSMPKWQNAYIERLNREYIKILSDEIRLPRKNSGK